MAVRRVFLLGILAAIAVIPAMAAEAAIETAGTLTDGSVDSSKKEEQKPLLPFIELQSIKIATRYNFVANDLGDTTRNHQQHKEAFDIRIRFDREAKFTLNMAVGSGNGFTSSWDALGIGSDSSSNLNVRELYLSLKPWKGLDLQYGGIPIARGAASEITTYDNDGFMTGARISIKNPQQLFFDEISGALSYLGDPNEPDVFHRFDRLNEANYHQILVSKKIGKRATISGEYASLSGIATLRQAVQLKAPELKVIDSLRYENYQRVEGITDFGFAVQADKRVHRKLVLGGGYADIDRYYGGLNGDRYNKGKRIFAMAKIDILQSLSAEVFIQKAVANNYPIANDVRLDMVLTYDLLPGIRKLGIFRTPK